jgi:bifunctional UDP-N-acetylglucosamine pyrophosphorylase/glucosamine-1-phosphate N-acetyltransferase
MLPVAGRPILEHLLSVLKANRVEEVLLVVGYRQGSIKDHFGHGERFGLDITYRVQSAPLGSADSVRYARDYVRDEPFLVINGDLLLDVQVVAQVLQRSADGKVPVLAAVHVEVPSRYGVVVVDADHVAKIVEKPPPSAGTLGNLVNAGIYVFPRMVFDAIDETPVSPRGELELTDTVRLLVKRGVSIKPVTVDSGSWLDIGMPWDLLEANRRALLNADLTIEGDVEEGAHLHGPVAVSSGARIRSGAYIEGPAFIGADSDVGPNCYIRAFTSIGTNARVGNACEIKNSLILDGARIGHLSYIGDSVIGKSCNVGAGTITANLRFDGAPIRVDVKGTRVDSGLRKLGAIVGDHVETGVGARLMPGVKVGAHSWIGPNVVIYEDVPPNSFLLQGQHLRTRERV